MEMVTGFMKINEKLKVKYTGETNPLMLVNDKIYEARVLKKGWFGIVDETREISPLK